MREALDAFWRAVGYCLHPRIIVLSLLPLAVMALLAGALAYFFWADAVHAVQQGLEGVGLLSALWVWLHGLGFTHVTEVLAPLLLVLVGAPLVAMLSLVLVAVSVTPAIVSMVSERRFAQLERRHGASFLASLLWSVGATLAALTALVVSLPLWLIPPLVLLVPPLIWGWLTYRVMAFDALAAHASAEERRTLLARHRVPLLAMGVVCGYLGAAPGIVWASGVVFAAAFVVLIPLAVWIYTLVFVFSSLWFTHYALAALERLRAERAAVPPPVAPRADAALPPVMELPPVPPTTPAPPPALPPHSPPPAPGSAP